MKKWGQKKEYRWLIALLAPLAKFFREAFAISLFTNLLALAVPLFTLQVYDRVVAHQGTATLVGLSIGVALALTFDFILRQSRSRLLQHVALQIDAQLGRNIYAKLASLPLRTLEERPGAFRQTIFADMSSVRAVLSGPSAVMLLDIPFALLFMLVIILHAPAVAWVLLLVIPAFIALAWFSGKWQHEQSAQEIKRTQTRENLLAELVAGRTTVKALRIDKALQDEFEELHAKTVQQAHERGVQADSFIALGQSLSLLTTALMIMAGALAIIDRELTTGALVAATMLTGRIIQPLNQLIATWRQFAGAKQSAERLARFFEEESERDTPTLTRPRPIGEISVEELSFSYAENSQPAVRALSFRLLPGQMVGIVGRNGCGKTTLIKLLLGLYTPSKGRVLLDNADIRQFSRQEMSEWIGYVPQECFLFAGSIKANIAKARPHASDEIILASAKLSGTDQFVGQLEQGYDTQIGEAGHMLSGGQRQRIAIARALLLNPPVLLLDEVSNHLDTEAERTICQTLQQLKTNRTIITISHSPLMLQSCDQIMVLDKGQIIMAGATAEILPRISGAPPSAKQGDAS